MAALPLATAPRVFPPGSCLLCLSNAARFRQQPLVGGHGVVIETPGRGGLASCGEHWICPGRCPPAQLNPPGRSARLPAPPRCGAHHRCVSMGTCGERVPASCPSHSVIGHTDSFLHDSECLPHEPNPIPAANIESVRGRQVRTRNAPDGLLEYPLIPALPWEACFPWLDLSPSLPANGPISR